MTVSSESKGKVEKVGFDYNKYLVSHDPQIKIVNIPGTDESFEVSVKTISWSKRNQIISKNLNWDSTGNTSFSADGYVRDCLKEMLVDAPWGRTTEALLISFDDRLGTALETLVPKAFGEGADDTMEDSGTVKKEL